MNLQTDIFRRYFIHSPTDLFHILTDGFTDGYFPSVNHNITDGMKIRRYISSGNLFFFGAQIPFVKPSANGFFVFPTDIATEGGITDEGKADGRNPSVMTSVKKSSTNFLSHTDGIGPSVKL